MVRKFMDFKNRFRSEQNFAASDTQSFVKRGSELHIEATEKTVVETAFVKCVFRASRILRLPFKIELIYKLNCYTLTPPSRPSFFILSYHIFYFEL